jgi:hypothetical protein
MDKQRASNGGYESPPYIIALYPQALSSHIAHALWQGITDSLSNIVVIS